MPRPSAAIALTCLSSVVALPTGAETTGEALLGTWQTPIVEQPSPDGTQSAWLRQTIVFMEDGEIVRAEGFLDPDATERMFTYESVGPYEIVGPSGEIPGALDVNLWNDSSTMTIHVDQPQVWTAIGMGDCPLRLGEAVDISECVSGPPFMVANCMDMDVAMVDGAGGRLRMGEEGVDRCVERPAGLSETVFLRVD